MLASWVQFCDKAWLSRSRGLLPEIRFRVTGQMIYLKKDQVTGIQKLLSNCPFICNHSFCHYTWSKWMDRSTIFPNYLSVHLYLSRKPQMYPKKVLSDDASQNLATECRNFPRRMFWTDFVVANVKTWSFNLMQAVANCGGCIVEEDCYIHSGFFPSKKVFPESCGWVA